MTRNAPENLLHNAVKHAPNGGEIRVEVNGNDRATIDVIDEGKGIPEEDLEKVFHRFYRVPGTPAGGIGLGLSIVKGIVEAHGGSVQAINRNDRPGIDFRVTLPVWKEKVPGASP